MSNNPLSEFFRIPSIYLKLPSNGEFYPEGTLDMPTNNELPVYPMTAIDEITYRTPDALYNGSAVINVIESCVPSIKDAWSIPGIDIDAILAAIRIASYGHEMEISTTCPKCEESVSYGIDMRNILEQMQTVDYDTSVSVGDLEIFFKPLNYKQINDSNVVQFEEQKLINVIEDADMSEEDKLSRLSEAFNTMTKLTIDSIAQSINYIKTPETLVDNNEHINEFLNNCERSVYTKIRDRILDIKKQTELKPLNIKCNECEHEYEQPFTLDMSNFFV
jgi:hypothetical protein